MNAPVQAVEQPVVLDAADFRMGVDVISDCDNVQRWVNRNKPIDDVQMEAGNTKNCAQFKLKYQRMRDALCEKYEISELELLGLLLLGMADSSQRLQ